MKQMLNYLAVVLLLLAGSAKAQEVIAGAYELVAVDSTAFKAGTNDTIQTGNTFRFWITMDNNSTYNVVGSSNGFRVYSPDGATWTTTAVDTFAHGGVAVFGKTQYDGAYFFNNFSINGQGSDTVAIGGISIFGPGMEPNTRYDSAYVITIGPIPAGIAQDNHNKHICLDSVFNYPPTNEWSWSDIADPAIIRPAWAGPYCWTIWDQQTLVNEGNGTLPGSFALAQNYPNPFNPSTEIKFELPEKSHVTLTVYNVLGQEVKVLVNEELSAGNYSEVWDGRDARGKQVTTGVYFYKLQAGTWSETKKMTFLK
jgi:hypothetical protein